VYVRDNGRVAVEDVEAPRIMYQGRQRKTRNRAAYWSITRLLA